MISLICSWAYIQTDKIVSAYKNYRHSKKYLLVLLFPFIAIMTVLSIPVWVLKFLCVAQDFENHRIIAVIFFLPSFFCLFPVYLVAGLLYIPVWIMYTVILAKKANYVYREEIVKKVIANNISSLVEKHIDEA